MALVRSEKTAVPAVRLRLVAAIAIGLSLYLSVGQADGQTEAIRGRSHPCRGTATVSVATLQVPEKAWKHFEKARVLALKHSAAESERESGKALEIAPFFAAARVLQASQQLLLRDYDGAIANIVAARKNDPDLPWEAVILAGAYNGLRRFDDALTAIEGLQGAEADSWQAKYEQARAQIGLGDEERALKLTEEVMALAPKDFSDALLVRANSLMIAHRWSEAKECLNRYLAVRGPQPRREQVLTALASMNRHMKDEDPVSLASR